MTSAREQARDNASSRLMDAYQEGLPISWGNIESAADAASDVWEPIVRDLLNASAGMVWTAEFQEAFVAAKEALGE